MTNCFVQQLFIFDLICLHGLFIPHAVSLFLWKLSLKRGSAVLSLAIIVLVLKNYSLLVYMQASIVSNDFRRTRCASRDYENATEMMELFDLLITI